MASFQKHGNFWRYRISYFDDDHNRKYLTQSGFETKAKAKVAATEEEYKIYDQSGSLYNRNFTFHEYYTNWVEVFKKLNVGKSSMNRFKNIGNVINNYFPNTKIKDVTPIEYQRFMNDYSKTRSTLTISKTNSIIRSCVKDAINDQIVASNFTKNVTLNGAESRKRAAKYLAIDQFKQLIKYANQNKSLYSLTYYMILSGY